jgi:L-lactate utilization protein LutB
MMMMSSYVDVRRPISGANFALAPEGIESSVEGRELD